MPTFELPKEPTRIWDLDVPVVIDEKTGSISAYITGAIEEPSCYNELYYLLLTAKSGTEVFLYINTPGGIIDSALMLAAGINKSKATVTACLSGTVASAGTLLTMVCDKVEVAPHLSFMIHNYSGGMAGKGHEMKARQKFTDEHLNNAFKSFYSGFLSDDEMTSVIDGTDLWMGTSEVLSRWEGRVEHVTSES